MKKAIDVKNKDEGNAIEAALKDPVLRATVITVGVLMQLPEGSRERVLRSVMESLNIPPQTE